MEFLSRCVNRIKKIGSVSGLSTLAWLGSFGLAHAASPVTLAQLCNNFSHTIGDGLQIVLYAVTGMAIVFCFIGFHHLRMHHNEPQGRHVGKSFIHMIVAAGFLSGAPLLHMMQNTLLQGVGQGVVHWNMTGFNRNISPEHGSALPPAFGPNGGGPVGPVVPSNG